MLILIHGDHIVKSREILQQQIESARKQGITEIIHLDGKSCSLSELIQATESQSLFGENNRLVVIESLWRRRSKTDLTDLLSYLGQQLPNNNSIIIWEDKVLTATQLKKLSGFKPTAVTIPKSIFKLTDSITPTTSKKQLIQIFNTTLETDAPEFILIMLARQIRQLIQALDPSNKLPPWQKQKLSKNAQTFGLKKLVRLHHQLTQLDVNNKTGQSAADLTSGLTHWLISF